METDPTNVRIPDEGDDKIRSVRPVVAADWSRVTATGSENSKLPTPRTLTKETSNLSNDKSPSASPPNDKRCCPSACPLNGSGNQSRLSAFGSAEENLCPRASHFVLAAPGPMASHFSLAKDESCPCLSTPGQAEEKQSNPLATLGHAASAPAPTGSQSLKTPESAAYSPCPRPRLPVLSSSTTYPIAMQLPLAHPHRRALHVSLVLIQEPRVRS
jgi:hypothetical protein